MKNTKTLVMLGLCLLQALAFHAHAQSTLDRVRSSGKLVLAYRENALPFSYLDANKRPQGYAIDLCLKLADSLKTKLKLKSLDIGYVLIHADDRIPTIEQGKADLECGATTNNAERRQRVSFTIPHYITGIRMLVKSKSTVTKIEDLGGKRVVSTKGSTAATALDKVNTERGLRIQVLSAPNHAAAMAMVEADKADAFVMDDVLLFGMIAASAKPEQYKVVGKFISTEPLAIMMSKKDLEFKKMIDEEMRRLILSGEINAIYDKWFVKPIPPKQQALKIPQSYLLKEIWKYPSDQVPF